MRMRYTLACLLLATLCQSGIAHARDQLGQRDAVVVDPQRAYILYRTPSRMDVRFLREVDAAERAAWEAEREAAYQRARERNARSIASWDRDMSQCRGEAAASAYCRARGPRPAELTPETFAFAPPEADNFVDVSRGRVFERTETEFTYLRAVDPGSYVLYGQIVGAENFALGVCLCMGSVRFEARPGQIVDLGELRLMPGEESGPVNQGRFGPDGRLPSPSVVPAEAGSALPDRLAGLPVAPADLRAADRMPNYFGILIDRLAPVAGVLDYRRDEVIDVKAQGAATAGTR